MHESDAYYESDAESDEARELPACPSCGVEFREELTPRGRAFRCSGCHSWLFRQIWDVEEMGERCHCCSAPLHGDATCPLCGYRRAPWAWLQKGPLASISTFLRPSMLIRRVPLRKIRGDGFQPRLSIDIELFENLRQSLSRHGIVQPLLLRGVRGKKRYSIICGHRRFLAAKQLQWSAVPARILHCTEKSALLLRIAENLHREDPSVLELAESLERYYLVSRTEERSRLGRIFGLSDEFVAYALSLLRAPIDVREEMIYGAEPGGQATVHSERASDQVRDLRRLIEASPTTQGSERTR